MKRVTSSLRSSHARHHHHRHRRARCGSRARRVPRDQWNRGHAEPTEPDEITRDGGLSAIGAIVAIGAGIAQIVSSILEWRDRLQKARETQRLNVVIQDAKGNRLLLDRATPEQIAAVLRTLQV